MTQNNEISSKNKYISEIETKLNEITEEYGKLKSSYNVLNGNYDLLSKQHANLTEELNDSLTQNAEGSIIEAEYKQLQLDVEKYKNTIQQQLEHINALSEDNNRLSSLIQDRDHEIYLNSLKFTKIVEQVKEYDSHKSVNNSVLLIIILA